MVDLLIRIKNGYLARQEQVAVRWSKSRDRLGAILVKQGYLASQEIKTNGSHKDLFLKLKYDHRTPALTNVKIVSRPSLRIFVGKNNLPWVLGGLGFAVISTPQGLMTSMQAKKLGLGGEVICEVW